MWFHDECFVLEAAYRLGREAKARCGGHFDAQAIVNAYATEVTALPPSNWDCPRAVGALIEPMGWDGNRERIRIRIDPMLDRHDRDRATQRALAGYILFEEGLIHHANRAEVQRRMAAFLRGLCDPCSRPARLAGMRPTRLPTHEEQRSVA